MEKDKKTSVISIGYGEHLFVAGNQERLRMEACAKVTGQYHMVVFVKLDKFETVDNGLGLILHPVTASSGFLKLWKAIVLVRRIMANLDGAVVVTAQDPFETGLVAFIATRFSSAKLNIQEHGDVFSGKYWKSEKVTNIFRFYVGLFILKQADSVRVVSRRIADTLQSYGVKKDKIRNLAVFTDPKPFIRIETRSDIRNMFLGDRFIFLTVARFVPQKNLQLLLEAFYMAHQTSPNIRLIIVGKGPDLEKMKEIIKSNEGGEAENLVKIIPWTDDVASFFASTDAYVLSSNYEGWGRVLIEALYAKLPIVTTDVGCVGEVIFDKKHGLVVPVNNQEKLVEALVELSTNQEVYNRIKNNLMLEEIPSQVSYDSYATRWISTLV